jgi:hypothetical protein
VVCECKAYTWTASGNPPSAKISNLKEAVQYLRLLPPDTMKILTVLKSSRPPRSETLGEYFVRLNGYILGDVCVVELSENEGFRILQGSIAGVRS